MALYQKDGNWFIDYYADGKLNFLEGAIQMVFTDEKSDRKSGFGGKELAKEKE